MKYWKCPECEEVYNNNGAIPRHFVANGCEKHGPVNFIEIGKKEYLERGVICQL